MAFSRWRLYTCNMPAGQPGQSTPSKKIKDRAPAKDIGPNVNVAAAASRHKQSVKEIWEAAGGGGGVSRKQNVHEIIMTKARADRLLAWELCEDYEAEMVERVNHRQAANNVPILPIMPFVDPCGAQV